MNTEFQQSLQFQLPSPTKLFTPTVTVFLILMFLGYTALIYFSQATTVWLALVPSGLMQGRIWQLLTYSFLNPCPCNLVFNGIILLFVGSQVEREWRTKSFLMLWLAVTGVCGLAWAAVNILFGWNYAGVGTDGFVYGIIAAFGLLFRRQKILFFFWTTEAQFVALLLIGIGLIVGIANPICWVWVGGALVSYIFIKSLWALKKQKTEKLSAQPVVRSKGFVDLE